MRKEKRNYLGVSQKTGKDMKNLKNEKIAPP